ncbi:MAG: hypothetical protein ACFE9Q_05775 [Candidatus Hodarchaeota archaeon]
MKNLEKYIIFCRKFNHHFLPKLRFKVLNERYNHYYRKVYKIDEDSINRASFIIFIFSFGIIVLLSLILLEFNIIITILYSLILSTILSYKFNLILYNEINKIESDINAILYLIKIDFSLIRETLNKNSDHCIYFIKLIKDYKIPLLGHFENILKSIHEGNTPENELLKVITPSEDFNEYLHELFINNFDYKHEFNEVKENTLEKNFKIYLREVQSKISIIFFIGMFFPIGLCFLILFQLINLIILIFIIPFFLYFLNYLCSKFVNKNTYLIGFLNKNSNMERKKFNEFLLFLKSLAINLKSKVSPEKAFLKSYMLNKNLYEILVFPLKNQITRLLNFSCSFHDIIQFFKLELKSMRYNIILDIIEKFVTENATYTSEKIIDILEILHQHQKLENRLDIIIKGEKFKIFFFIFLLPIIIGAISGMFPFFILITKNTNSSTPIGEIGFTNLINMYYLILISFVFIASISITANNFLNIIKYQKKSLIIFISNTIFILTFISSFINTLYII